MSLTATNQLPFSHIHLVGTYVFIDKSYLSCLNSDDGFESGLLRINNSLLFLCRGDKSLEHRVYSTKKRPHYLRSLFCLHYNIQVPSRFLLSSAIFQ